MLNAKSKILNLLEKIIKKDENAFIIFLGDHGPHLIKIKFIFKLSKIF